MKLNTKQLVTIDFETYWAHDFSLANKHLNTSEYIRDPQFMAHCCAIKIGNDKTRVIKGKDLAKEFAKIDWKNSDLLAHNCAFDGAILAWVYGHTPRYYFDTLSMTRGLHSEMTRAGLDAIAKFYGIGAKSATYLAPTKGLRVLSPEIYAGLAEGCEIDNDLCFEVFKKQVEVFPDDELDLIDLTMRMFIEPALEVDIPRAEAALVHETNARLRALALSRVDEKTLNSSDKFAQALRDVGCEPPKKWSAKQNCMTYAFAKNDPDFTELLEHEDIRVVRLVQGRLAAKSTIVETRAYRLIKAGKDGQKLPVLLNYSGAKTHRWSGGNKLNLQNLNRQEYDDDGSPVPMTGELRKSIIAPKGHVVMVADSAQIEARTLAWWARQDDLVEAFRQGVDVYRMAASAMYGIPMEEVTKDQRFVNKVKILGLGYGMGAPKFRTTLALGMMGPPVYLSPAESKSAVTTYRRDNHMIPKKWKEAEGILKAMAAGKEGDWGILSYDAMTVWLPNGMGLHYPGLRVVWDQEKERVSGYEYLANGHYKKIYGGLLVENVVQALARIIVSTQMLETQDYFNTLKLKKGEIARIASMSHDEIISVVPARLAKTILPKQLDIMRVAPGWAEGLPLNAEGGYAVNYSK